MSDVAKLSDVAKSPPVLDRAAILSARKSLQPQEVPCPDLGGRVFVLRMTAGQVDQYMEAVRQADKSLTRGTVLAFALTDESGTRLFTDKDAPALAELPAATVEPIVDEFFRVNGLTPRKN